MISSIHQSLKLNRWTVRSRSQILPVSCCHGSYYRKGVSIQHYLVKLLDRVISALDRNSRGEAIAVICTMIDWRQAFPRQCPTLAIKSFIKNGVCPSLIPILMSFFENRRMSQGSTKGVLSYMSQSNNNADSVPLHWRMGLKI